MKNMPNTSQSKFCDQVLEKISSGKAKMRSKSYFILRTTLFLFEILFVSFLLVYLISFIFFLLHETGIWFAPSFGLRGVQIFLTSLPWVFIFFIFLIIIFLEILLKRYTMVYKHPFLYSMFIIFLMSLLFGALLANTSLHRNFLRQAEKGELPLVGSFYRGFCGKRFSEVHPGRVVDFTQNVICIQNKNGDIVAVFIEPNTKFPVGRHIQKGDHVVIMGNREQNHILAMGIRPVREESLEPIEDEVISDDAKEKCDLVVKEK